MAINISILSHAFVLGKEIAPIQVSMSNDQPSVAKEYQQYSLERVRKADYGEEGESITSLQKQFSSLDAKKLSPSPGNEGGEAWNSKREKGEPPITPETSRDRCVERGERLSSERIRSVDRGDRPPMPERVYSRSPTAESALSRSPNADREKAEVFHLNMNVFTLRVNRKRRGRIHVINFAYHVHERAGSARLNISRGLAEDSTIVSQDSDWRRSSKRHQARTLKVTGLGVYIFRH